MSALCFACLIFGCVGPSFASNFSEARDHYFAGEYDACIALTREQVDKGIWNDVWSKQLLAALLTTGRYEEALEVYENVKTKFSNSIPLRMLGIEAYRFNGRAAEGKQLLDAIPELVQSAPWRYSDRDNLLAIGRFLLNEGIDARRVLESYYDRILKSDPKFVDAYVAVGELALEKADYQEAVNSLQQALELQPQNPDIHYLLARAWEPSDSEKATKQLNAALEINPSHPDSLLLNTQNLIDSERYEEAGQVLEQLFEVNPHHPQGWALKAAIAHLQGEYAQEGEFRGRGLKLWNTNPQVDFLIGKMLSKHYRFAEGVTYQRRSLKLDPTYSPAKFQLAQDLLRVGQDDEGWSIVDQVAVADKYNVVAFNLKTLQERLAQFTTLEVPGFIVRMDAREASIYGQRVLDLLQEARQTLPQKYSVELAQPTTVEIFPQQSDFAIRTFGLPGGAGYLGVCFGSLITANSPASQGESPSNWESVLWHEYCHVVTLNKTKNRMPRWLSEGISVYEEIERDSSWGQTMTPQYKQMLLGEDFVPLSQLSGAFLTPKSPLHLQFAYFESSLAVRYLIDQHGLPLLLKLLDDLGMGVTIEEAFSRRYGDAQALDGDFEKYVQDAANQYLPDTSFARDAIPPNATPVDLQRFLQEQPGNYFAQRRVVEQLIRAENWKQAQVEVERLLELFPADTDPGGGLELSARIARELGDREGELEALETICEFSADNLPALNRLLELSRESQNWSSLQTYANKMIAVQPLIAAGHEALAQASKALGTPSRGIDSLRALQQLEPLDPAALHFELANSLVDAGLLGEARMEALKALEFTPRYREAQILLVSIREQLDRAKADMEAAEEEAAEVKAAAKEATEEESAEAPPG